MDLEEMQELQQVDLQRDDAKRVLQTVVEQIIDPPFVEALDGEIEAQALLSLTAARESREAEAIVGTAQRRIQASDEQTLRRHDHRPSHARRAAARPLLTAPETSARSAMQTSRRVSAPKRAAIAERWLRDFREQAVAIWNTRQTQLRADRDEAQDHVDDLSVLVEQRRVRLTDSDLGTYDEYRQRRPRVVAGVVGGVCEECRLTLPTMIITLRSTRRPSHRVPLLRMPRPSCLR